MSARLVLPHDAPREEWLAARRDGVTASEIATLLGISPFDSPFNLYWQKAGAIPDDYDNERMSLGRHLEPWIAERFCLEHTDLHFEPGGLYASVARPWQMATPDGRLYDDVCRCEEMPHDPLCLGGTGDVEQPAAVWEGKTSGTYEEWGDDGSDEIPAYIRAQVLWQMDVMEVGIGYVSCLFLSSQQIRTYEIGYDIADVDLMRLEAVRFLDRVQAQDPPPIDAHHATTAALKHLFPAVDEDETATIPDDLAREYEHVREMYEHAKERKAGVENRLRQAMGASKYATTAEGGKVASRSVYDRKGYTVEPCTIDRLNPARAKKKEAS